MYLFSVSTAENLNLDDSVASLITAGTALHWFEHAQFYKECDRVLVPGGVVAAYCYDPSGVVALQCFNAAEISAILKEVGANAKAF